ncbi:MAG: phosphate ABC transporter substrate-binding protein PstS [Nitrospirota bacterium]|nr:phosphate ABC transporter substrate-binding protein PstS [Nitrospirota bacterium]
MRTRIALIAAAVLGLSGTAQAATTITGAGATFPYPIYSKWAHAYNQQTGIQLNYQSIGSGGGIKQIKEGTVDFGASDAPLGGDDLAKAGLLQFPTVVGAVVPVVNFLGISDGQLKLSGPVLADIYLGKVTKWNDAAIAALNPGLKLPAQDIAVVSRADGSGTTWIFTNYLSKVSGEWKSKVGNDKAVSWPVGMGGKGNEGVAAFVKKTSGAIGYVEYAYAKQNKMITARLQNRAGAPVAANVESIQAACEGADWKGTPGFGVVLTDQAGKGAWPIAGATFILVYRTQKNPAQGTQVLNFFDWAYKNGDDAAVALDYVPLPDSVVKLIHSAWGDIKGADGKPVWTAH